MKAKFSTSHSWRVSTVRQLVTTIALLGTFEIFAMQIYIQPPTGANLTLDVEGNEVIVQVKAKIQDQAGYLPVQQRLFFNGLELEDSQTLADYDIQKESTLQMLLWGQATHERSVSGAGGGYASSSLYGLSYTIGQPAIGTASSVSYALAAGFWPDHGATPVAAALVFGTKAGVTAGLPTADLIIRSIDPNGEPLHVVSVSGGSTSGGNVVLDGDSIAYTPTDGFTGMDTFTYLIADTGGDAAQGTVTAAVSGVDSNFSFNNLGFELAGNDVHLGFLGIANSRYALDRTSDLTPPVAWEPQFTNAAAADGYLMFISTPMPGTNNFWRTRQVP